jgi:hypothetical protein
VTACGADLPSVIVTGYMIRLPQAGNVLRDLQYMGGLDRLGCRVTSFEPNRWPRSSSDPIAKTYVGAEVIRPRFLSAASH